MNCSLKSDRQKYTPYGCVHMEVFHLIRRTETISVSHNRENLLHVQHAFCWNLLKYGDCVANLRHRLRFPSLLSVLSFLDFLDILGRQVSLYLPNLQVNSGVPGLLLLRHVQKCIFLPSLRTRRCVSIEFSCFWFPCSWPIFSTRCLEYHRAFRRNRILHSRGTCRDSEDQIHRPLWLCHDPFFSFLFLHPFFTIVLVQLAKLKFWEQQNKPKLLMLNMWRRLFHSSRVKSSFVNMSASWFLVSRYLIWILGSWLILSNNKSSATLWVQDTCLIARLRPLMINFNHGFAILKNEQRDETRRDETMRYLPGRRASVCSRINVKTATATTPCGSNGERNHAFTNFPVQLVKNFFSQMCVN